MKIIIIKKMKKKLIIIKINGAVSTTNYNGGSMPGSRSLPISGLCCSPVPRVSRFLVLGRGRRGPRRLRGHPRVVMTSGWSRTGFTPSTVHTGASGSPSHVGRRCATRAPTVGSWGESWN